MSGVIRGIEAVLDRLPFALLEGWGRFACYAGFALAVFAFGGFTFRAGGGWGLGRERQAWDARAFLSIPLTFLLILVTGFLGSFIVLVPGAQTFESLKDLAVFLCIVLFGYPALLAVPFAYGLSDLIEGVPPGFLWDWLPGYFINPACFWIGYQLFGKDPDFRRARTWGRYLLFVLLFLGLEPVLWGHLCAGTFSPEISYRTVTPALFFTTGLTWILAPLAMLGALPLARKFGMYWAEIPGHVKERSLGRREWIWEAGGGAVPATAAEGWPLRMLLLAPFIVLMLTMVGATAFVTLRSAQEDADKLATRLHEEVAANIRYRLDEFLAKPAPAEGLRGLLQSLSVAQNGLALILDRSGSTVASSAPAGDPVAAKAVGAFRSKAADGEFRFHHVSERPLERKTWLARATAYRPRSGPAPEWIVLTAIPESYYLAGVKAGQSRSALVFSLALLLALGLAALLAAAVTGGLRRLSLAAQGLAGGDLHLRVPPHRLEELNTLSRSFNDMADRLARSIDDLRERETFIRLALEAAHVGSWEWDLAARRFKESEGLGRMYGLDGEVFDGRLETLLSFCHPRDLDRLRRILTGTLVEAAVSGFEIRILRRDGVERDLWFLGRPHLDVGGVPSKVLGIAIDITERRSLEEQFRQAQKMEAVGRLAGGIAHDFNNLLTAILGFSEFLKDGFAAADPRRNDAEEIIATATRATALTRQLLAFSRRQVLNSALFDLNPRLREMRKMLQRIIGEDVLLELRECPTSAFVKADPGQVEQAVLNLSVNARDAMPQGGKLLIEIRRVSLGSPASEFVQLSVVDNGSGMTPEVRARAFEPFFTTKGAGKGTGLGLPMVYGFVQQSGGQVEIESEVGRGTAVHLRFPAVEAPTAEACATAAASRSSAGTETVLLVEDDGAVRKIAARVLENAGYRLLTAADGAEALRMAEGFAAPVDILVTDVVMPGMNGPALAEALGKRHPGLLVLFVSGYTDDDVLRHGLLHEKINFLQKPYAPQALTAKVREILDGRPKARRPLESATGSGGGGEL